MEIGEARLQQFDTLVGRKGKCSYDRMPSAVIVTRPVRLARAL